MKSPIRALFILKLQSDYGYGNVPVSSGLFNSAQFVADMLRQSGITARVVQVTDNNDIDREVSQFGPSHVFIEALWVVPEKFPVLRKLHSRVKWIVRVHSELPFLSNEGMAIDWISRYTAEDVYVAANSEKTARDLKLFVPFPEKVLYLPNYYPAAKRDRVFVKKPSHMLDVACFGAIRPLKNQLIQAVAAMEFAHFQEKLLRFHVNGTRCEMGGNPILKNLRSLFANSGYGYQLVEHPWMNHREFLRVLAHMDAGLAVSYSETFNIVAADMVTMGVPTVASSEIPWIGKFSIADPNSTTSIAGRLEDAVNSPLLGRLNRFGLWSFSRKARAAWLEYFGE